MKTILTALLCILGILFMGWVMESDKNRDSDNDDDLLTGAGGMA